MIAAIIVCAIFTAATLSFSLVPIIVGKVRLYRALRPVEYYPPRGYSPIDFLIKYYGFRANTHALVNPIMLYWAERGFITIEEDCKRGLKLTKLKDIQPLENRATGSALFYDDFRAEKKLFDSIFRTDTVFYTLAAGASYQTDVNDFIKECKDNAKDEKTRTSRNLSLAAFIFSVFSAIVSTLTVAFTAGPDPVYLTMIFPLVGMVFFHFIPNEEVIGMIKYPFFAVWGGAPFGVALAMSETWAMLCLLFSTLASALNVILLADRIDIRPQEDVDLFGRMMAFKTFLLDAEVDRLNTLVEEDPDYFYDILPYCYILKITEKLKPKFDRITLDGPSWYLGDLRNTLMF